MKDNNSEDLSPTDRVESLATVETSQLTTNHILKHQLTSQQELELKKLDLDREKNQQIFSQTRTQLLFTETQKLIILFIIGITVLATVGFCLYTLFEKDETNRQFAITALTGIISALTGLYAGQKIASK